MSEYSLWMLSFESVEGQLSQFKDEKIFLKVESSKIIVIIILMLSVYSCHGSGFSRLQPQFWRREMVQILWG